MVTTYLQVKYRIGDIEANIGTGSQFIVTEAISGAIAYVNQQTGNLIDDLVDSAVADYAAAQVVRTFFGRDNMSVSNIRNPMAVQLEESGKMRLQALGIKSRKSVTNQ